LSELKSTAPDKSPDKLSEIYFSQGELTHLQSVGICWPTNQTPTRRKTNRTMQIDRLLADASGFPVTWPKTSIRNEVVALLNRHHGDRSITLKGVDKWAERGSIPGHWLMKIAALPTTRGQVPLNLTNYA
jgi:hypothetical protein